MCWRRPKAGCWITAPPQVAFKPQYYTMLCQCSPPETALALIASLHSSQVQHTQDRSFLFLLPLQALFSATTRNGYKFGGLLSPLCATLGWGRGALKRGSRRKLSTCLKRSQKQRVRSAFHIAYICKKRNVPREPMFLAEAVESPFLEILKRCRHVLLQQRL